MVVLVVLCHLAASATQTNDLATKEGRCDCFRDIVGKFVQCNVFEDKYLHNFVLGPSKQ